MSTASAGAAIPQTVVNSTKDSASKGSWGGLIGIILIVLLIIMAAFYSWGERLETQTPPEADTETVE